MDYRITIPVPKYPLDALFYEIRMLENCFPLGYSPRGLDKNFRLESFLLHTRNLIDFLENNKNGNDDIIASGFKDVNGRPIPRIKLSLSSDIKQKINKHLSHLTKTRLKEKPEWNIELIKSSINQGLIQFVNLVSESYFPTIAGRTKDDFRNLVMNSLIPS